MTATAMEQILLVSDMDGTLINAPQPVCERNLEAIQRFVDAGGHFSVATGRAIGPARAFVGDIPLSSPAILVNGGMIYDYREEKILTQVTLPLQAAEYLLDIKTHFPNIGIEVVVGREIYNAGHNEFTYRRVATEKMKYRYAFPQNIPAGWNKVLFATKEENQGELLEYIRQKSYNGVYFIPTSKVFVEMVPEKATKGDALLQLANHLNIQRENTCAIGDYYNDISMLDMCGVSATPAEAPDDVKSHADYIVGSSKDGAVADFINQIFTTVVKG